MCGARPKLLFLRWVDADRQRVVVVGDNRPQEWPNLVGTAVTCSAGGGLLFLRGNVSTLGIMLEVAIEVDREHIKMSARIAQEDEQLRTSECLVIGALHFALFHQVSLPASKRMQHLNVIESRTGERGFQRIQRWTIEKEIFVPRYVLLNLPRRAVGFCVLALCNPLRAVVCTVTSHRINEQQVPAVTLAVAHHKRWRITGQFGKTCLPGVKIDKLCKLSRGSLHHLGPVEIVSLSGETRRHNGDNN